MLWVGVFIAVLLAVYGWRRLIAACEAANRADWGGKWVNRLDGLNRIFCRRFHRLTVDGPSPVPATGAALVIANHVSGLDPLLLIAANPRPLRYLIAREQYQRWWLKWLFDAIGCIPIARDANSRSALAQARNTLERGEVVALFPHGRMHLDHEPPVPLKRGVLHLAEFSGAPIVPFRVEGVRGQGLTVAAVLLRSRARIKGFAPLHYSGESPDEFLQRLAHLLDQA